LRLFAGLQFLAEVIAIQRAAELGGEPVGFEFGGIALGGFAAGLVGLFSE
jgi:hypothetical protein